MVCVVAYLHKKTAAHCHQRLTYGTAILYTSIIRIAARTCLEQLPELGAPEDAERDETLVRQALELDQR
ncbi:hypothetical protein D3C85_1807400 [compost metagenome]